MAEADTTDPERLVINELKSRGRDELLEELATCVLAQEFLLMALDELGFPMSRRPDHVRSIPRRRRRF